MDSRGLCNGHDCKIELTPAVSSIALSSTSVNDTTTTMVVTQVTLPMDVNHFNKGKDEHHHHPSSSSISSNLTANDDEEDDDDDDDDDSDQDHPHHHDERHRHSVPSLSTTNKEHQGPPNNPLHCHGRLLAGFCFVYGLACVILLLYLFAL